MLLYWSSSDQWTLTWLISHKNCAYKKYFFTFGFVRISYFGKSTLVLNWLHYCMNFRPSLQQYGLLDLQWLYLDIFYIVFFDSAIWSQCGVELGSVQTCFMCYHIVWVDDEKMTQNLSFLFIYIICLGYSKSWHKEFSTVDKRLTSIFTNVLLIKSFFKFLYAWTYKCCQSLSNWGSLIPLLSPQFVFLWVFAWSEISQHHFRFVFYIKHLS